jgi:hypothetical protein
MRQRQHEIQDPSHVMGDETIRRFGRDDGCLEGLREGKAAAYPFLRRGKAVEEQATAEA